MVSEPVDFSQLCSHLQDTVVYLRSMLSRLDDTEPHNVLRRRIDGIITSIQLFSFVCSDADALRLEISNEPLHTIGLQQELIGKLQRENDQMRAFGDKVREFLAEGLLQPSIKSFADPMVMANIVAVFDKLEAKELIDDRSSDKNLHYGVQLTFTDQQKWEWVSGLISRYGDAWVASELSLAEDAYQKWKAEKCVSDQDIMLLEVGLAFEASDHHQRRRHQRVANNPVCE